MKKLSILLSFTVVLLLSSCATTLKAPSITQNEPINKFKFFYITPTETKTAVDMGAYVGQYGIYGSSSSKSADPAEVISGILIKNGMTRIPQLTQETKNNTIVVNYAETGRRNAGLGYTIEVTIQMIAASDYRTICTCTAEGQGSTEVDDIQIAINRALTPLFK